MKNRVRKAMTVLATMALVLGLGSMSVGAVGVANVAVTGAFTTLADDVIATLGAIGVIAVTIMAIFLAWKYGRKIFSQVAK